MKIYKVTRVKEINYDEYDSCIVMANSEEEVHEEIRKSERYWDFGKDDRIIEEIELTEGNKGVLLGSFNAG